MFLFMASCLVSHGFVEVSGGVHVYAKEGVVFALLQSNRI